MSFGGTNRVSALSVPSPAHSRHSSFSDNVQEIEDPHENQSIASERPLLSQHDDIGAQPSQGTGIPTIHSPSVTVLEPRGLFSTIKHRLATTWYIEGFLLLCSVACMALIVTFLYIHDDTPLDSWTLHTISINAVISVLAVVFKSTLFMAVSAALSQGKWIWFSKRAGTLNTFETIEAGSHDTLAAIRLLWHTRGKHLVSVGALVVALGPLLDPSFQQLISDYGRLVDLDNSAPNVTNATIGRSKHLDGATQCISTLSSDYAVVETTPDFAISAALFDGLSTANSHGFQNVSFACISGNCTWDEYTTIAVRSTCFDISEHLKKLERDEMTSTTRTNARQIVSSNSLTAPPSTYQVPSSTYEASSSETVSSVETSSASEVAPPALTYGAATSILKAFSDVSPLDSAVAPVMSYVTEATARRNKRGSSNDGLPGKRQSDSHTSWTDWTLDYYDLQLVNTNEGWRNASTFAVLQAAVVVNPNLTLNFKDSQTLLAAFILIRASNQTLNTTSWNLARPSAMECGLELALNTYNSSVVNNKLIENVVASSSQKVPSSFLPDKGVNQSYYHPHDLPIDYGTRDWNPIYHEHFLWRDDYILDHTTLLKNTSENFSVSQITLTSTLDFFTSLIYNKTDGATVKEVLQSDGLTLPIFGSPILQPFYNLTDTNATFHAIAKSMTNAIRKLGQDRMNGTTQQWVRYYQIRWAYLALPSSLLGIGIVFFVLSVVQTSRSSVPIWKANSIATMIHGPDERLRQQLRAIGTKDYLAVAGDVQAALKEKSPGDHALTTTEEIGAGMSRSSSAQGESYELQVRASPATSRTTNSTVTLVGEQIVAGAKQPSIRSVSPALTSPESSGSHHQADHTTPSDAA